MLLKEKASNILLWDFKNEILSSLMLKNFSSHLTWKLSWTIAFSQMVSIHYFNEREQD